MAEQDQAPEDSSGGRSGDEEEEFFESLEEIASTSGSDSDGERLARFKLRQRRDRQEFSAFVEIEPKYSDWSRNLASVGERRARLLQKLGLEEIRERSILSSSHSFPPSSAPPTHRVLRSVSDPGEHLRGDSRDSFGGAADLDHRRLGDGADDHGGGGDNDEDTRYGDLGQSLVNAGPILADRTNVGGQSSGDMELVYRIKDLDSGKEFIVEEIGLDGSWNRVREVGTGRELSGEEFDSSLGLLSPIVQEMRRVDRENNVVVDPKSSSSSSTSSRSSSLIGNGSINASSEAAAAAAAEGAAAALSPRPKPKKKKRWYSGFMRRPLTKRVNEETEGQTKRPWKMQRIKVRVCKKAVRDLADLYMGQEIHAHRGPIWALKFSTGGRYLASGGQDCVVRVWRVALSSNQVGVGVAAAATIDGEGRRQQQQIQIQQHRKRGSSKSSEEKAAGLRSFGIDSDPFCSLHGHTEDILDLSWSSSKLLLLSSSMDKTVRLWDVRTQTCLHVFMHKDYVTCIAFNPVDDTCFLSGSLDGKARIWSTVEHQVVDWTDLRDIVTAASYTPDGTTAMIGLYKGTCRFYDTTGNKLQLQASVDVVNKKGKNFRGKKITGIQCMPGNPSKILITSNDSQIRLFDNTDLIARFKGFRNMSSQISASFNRSGSFIISASEDSHVYLWNVTPPSSSCRGQLKISEKSCESFFSDSVTVAVPWSTESEAKNASDRRGALDGIFQLLKQSSFPGPCFECLTSTVFPVADDGSGSAPAPAPAAAAAAVASTLEEVIDDGRTAATTAGTAATAVNTAASEDRGDGIMDEEAADFSSAGLGLVIATASLSGEIRTFQNYAKEAAG